MSEEHRRRRRAQPRNSLLPATALHPGTEAVGGTLEDLNRAVRGSGGGAGGRRSTGVKRRPQPSRARLYRVLAVVGVVVGGLGLLIADGVRREGAELGARLVQVTGQVTLQREGKGSGSPAGPDLALSNRDVITTDAGGSAVVVFPDGSSVQVEPGTKFEVRLIDYARGDVRDRSMVVHSGSVVSRVSSFFGAKSRSAVCTPTAVAAARGTGYRVSYDPETRNTEVSVVDGTVEFKTSAGTQDTRSGNSVAASGYDLDEPAAVDPDEAADVQAAFDRIAQGEGDRSLLVRIELALADFFDPLLQILGVVPGGIDHGGTYAARRASCEQALENLRLHLVSLPEDRIPEQISLVTMEGLGVAPEVAPTILDAFAGNMLDSYRKRGSGFEITVRARDRDKTPYRLTASGVSSPRGGNVLGAGTGGGGGGIAPGYGGDVGGVSGGGGTAGLAGGAAGLGALGAFLPPLFATGCECRERYPALPEWETDIDEIRLMPNQSDLEAGDCRCFYLEVHSRRTQRWYSVTHRPETDIETVDPSDNPMVRMRHTKNVFCLPYDVKQTLNGEVRRLRGTFTPVGKAPLIAEASVRFIVPGREGLYREDYEKRRICCNERYPELPDGAQVLEARLVPSVGEHVRDDASIVVAGDCVCFHLEVRATHGGHPASWYSVTHKDGSTIRTVEAEVPLRRKEKTENIFVLPRNTDARENGRLVELVGTYAPAGKPALRATTRVRLSVGEKDPTGRDLIYGPGCASFQ